MSLLVNLASIGVGLTLISFIFAALVKRRMTESQAVLWLLLGLSAITLGVFPWLINRVAEFLGIWYPPTILLIVLIVGLFFIVLKNTIMTSVQNNELNELFLQVTLLKDEITQLKSEISHLREGGDDH